MIDQKDEKWLKKVLKECFDGRKNKPSKDEWLLEGFSMLVRNMVKNIEEDLSRTRTLWEREPTSKELKEKFDVLAKNLFYLKKYCREKIGREISEK